LVNLVLVDAIRRRATEIHVESYPKKLMIRYRVNGVLIDIMHPPLRLASAIINRILIITNMDIAKKKSVQKGQLDLVLGKKKTARFGVCYVPIGSEAKLSLELVDDAYSFDPLHVINSKEWVELRDKLYEPGIFAICSPTKRVREDFLRSIIDHVDTDKVSVVVFGDLLLPVATKNVHKVNSTNSDELITEQVQAILQHQSPDVVIFSDVDRSVLSAFNRSIFVGKLVLFSLAVENQSKAVQYLSGVNAEVVYISVVKMLCESCKKLATENDQVILQKKLKEKNIVLLSGEEPQLYQADQCPHCHRCGYSGQKLLIGFVETQLVEQVLPLCAEGKVDLLEFQKI